MAKGIPAQRGAGGGGTRFRLYAQPPVLAAYRQPVTIEVSSPEGSLGPGPHDQRMCVIAPVGKSESYGQAQARGCLPHATLPPWRGAVLPPACPGPNGGFDHLVPADPAFVQAHAFGCVRLALDVWERYLARNVPWYFGRSGTWLEIGLLGQGYDNGEVGRGWLELGFDRAPDRSPLPYALNLDVVAHEVGHLIIYGLVGEPPDSSFNPEYLGFHESMADLAALLVTAQLAPIIEDVLARTRGNLYTANELNRLGEISATAQIRIASNSSRMDEFVLGWGSEHDLSEPLTGAIFDFLLDLYQANLVELRAIPAALVAMAEEVGHLRAFAEAIQAEYDRWYPRCPEAFKLAFADARDTLGRYLAYALTRLTPSLTYRDVKQVLIEADRVLGGGRMRATLEADFAWRNIGRVPLGPYVGPGELKVSAALRTHRCARREMRRAKQRILVAQG